MKLRDWSVALVFCLLAYWSRHWMGYPNCAGDESNWIAITTHLRQGIDWPVSGPGFVHLVEAASFLFSSIQDTISMVGVFSVFIVLASLTRIYTSLLRNPIWGIAVSSYFWAPLFEGRPQQLGQILVIAGTWLCFEWLEHGRRSDACLLLLLFHFTAYYHILSHFVLIAMCILMLAGHAVSQPNTPHFKRQSISWLIVLSSLFVYFIPNGLYWVMIQDLHLNHLPKFSTRIAVSSIICGALAFTIVYKQRNFLHQLATSASQIFSRLEILCALGIIFIFLLLFQATLLPSHVWNAYGHDVWRSFIWWHLGDLATGLCFFLGAHSILRNQGKLSLTSCAPRFLAISTVSISLLASVALLLSVWMLDVNWLLRIMNYGLLFMAPVIAIGLVTLRGATHKLGGTIWLGLVCISLFFTIRHPSNFGC